MRFIVGEAIGNSRTEGELNGAAVFMPIEALSHISFLDFDSGYISDQTGHAIKARGITFYSDELEALQAVKLILEKGRFNGSNH